MTTLFCINNVFELATVWLNLFALLLYSIVSHWTSMSVQFFKIKNVMELLTSDGRSNIDVSIDFGSEDRKRGSFFYILSMILNNLLNLTTLFWCILMCCTHQSWRLPAHLADDGQIMIPYYALRQRTLLKTSANNFISSVFKEPYSI